VPSKPAAGTLLRMLRIVVEDQVVDRISASHFARPTASARIVRRLTLLHRFKVARTAWV
jgi:hypothetical protein